jgi:indole-3-glycerol phosphate synthase
MVDINTTFELAPLVPDNCIVVSESGIENEGNILSLKESGIHAVLVGSSLMRSKDLALKTKEIVDAGKMPDG